MAEKANRKQAVSVEELLWPIVYEQEATRRVLVRKGVVTNEEVLAEITTVRRELEAKMGR